MGQTAGRKLTREQESLCAKVRVIDDPGRLAERLREIDPSVYHDLVRSIPLPPSLISGPSEGEATTRELILVMALLTEGCVVSPCDGEAEVAFLMFGSDGDTLPDGSTIPGSFCARHVPTRTRLRKSGVFLAVGPFAALQLILRDYATALVEGVGIREIPRETLRRLALRRAKLHDLAPGDIARLEVNFIRHELTKYDTSLDTGLDLDGIRKHTYHAISLVYPDLTEECARQYSEKTRAVLSSVFEDLASAAK